MPVKVEYTCEICGAGAQHDSRAPFAVDSDGSVEWSQARWNHGVLCDEHLASLRAACEAWIAEHRSNVAA